ncbi:helix-turn-helix domain-containing protein [Mycolicibacterium hodleri]|uniref:AraC family transcriptional regulator n=1 Tax=Mycolicibacterium hodleri TaxID=49897 RepID=A0A502E3T7_9MYCO|nr:helix-turn-helix domain-containing protein [Mycolicibacterium hodleri]TPG31994.1 AraC family transcriptional regulator [Mycolicibacterium hodleri]
MGYRETAPPTALADLVETAWSADGGGGDQVRVLPDGCMDLIRMDGHVVVAGPDTSALTTTRGQQAITGLRFRPGVLPRLLGVPAAELVDRRVPLGELRQARDQTSLAVIAGELASRPHRIETAPWSLEVLRHITTTLASGTPVGQVAHDTGWSSRTLQRQCQAVYGYGPAMLRRVLRFRRATVLLRTGRSPADVAAAVGYSDQPHLHREIRAFADTTVTALATGYGSGANRSTEVPSGSWTVA